MTTKNAHAMTDAQTRLIARAQNAGGVMHVCGAEVRTARVICARGLGTLRDDGGIELRDGERWTFTLLKGSSK